MNTRHIVGLITATSALLVGTMATAPLASAAPAPDSGDNTAQRTAEGTCWSASSGYFPCPVIVYKR